MHFGFSNILYLVLGFLFLKVFPSMLGGDDTSNVLYVVFRIIGYILIAVGILSICL